MKGQSKIQMSCTIVEWGKEFPISGNLVNFFNNLLSFGSKTKQVIRTLTTILILYNDNTVLMIPILMLQNLKTCEKNYFFS